MDRQGCRRVKDDADAMEILVLLAQCYHEVGVEEKTWFIEKHFWREVFGDALKRPITWLDALMPETSQYVDSRGGGRKVTSIPYRHIVACQMVESSF